MSKGKKGIRRWDEGEMKGEREMRIEVRSGMREGRGKGKEGEH